MSRPGCERTTLPLFWVVGRLEEQLTSSMPTVMQVSSLKVLAEMIARIT